MGRSGFLSRNSEEMRWPIGLATSARSQESESKLQTIELEIKKAIGWFADSKDLHRFCRTKQQRCASGQSLLTIQVDSVGRKDGVIPSNVARAINFYQQDGPFIRGRSKIVAEDSQKTTILGNYKYDYRNKKVDDSALFWLARILEGAHAKLEFDPDVWAKVGKLIVHEIEESSTPAPEAQKDRALESRSAGVFAPAFRPATRDSEYPCTFMLHKSWPLF